MPQKQIFKAPINNHHRVTVEWHILHDNNRFCRYEDLSQTSIKKRNIDIRGRLRGYINRCLSVLGTLIKLIGRFLKWCNCCGNTQIDLQRIEHNNNRQSGIRKWNL